jgi:phage baseplate assembly protein W
MISIISSTRKYHIYEDFNLDMIKDPNTADIYTDFNEDTLKTSIRNILLTKKGTRRMQPKFGADLYQFLFQPFDEITANEIGDTIIEQINMWDSDLTVTDVSIGVDQDNNAYHIAISFKARTASIGVSTLKFILEQR